MAKMLRCKRDRDPYPHYSPHNIAIALQEGCVIHVLSPYIEVIFIDTNWFRQQVLTFIRFTFFLFFFKTFLFAIDQSIHYFKVVCSRVILLIED
jgi:hypothetical protein